MTPVQNIKTTGVFKTPPEQSIDVLARTVWGEARGEGETGMRAVAHVVKNRVAFARARGGAWWGNDIVAVCRKPYQFSCWNLGDPSRATLVSVDGRNPAFRIARKIAAEVVNDLSKEDQPNSDKLNPPTRPVDPTYRRITDDDPTGGATHYHRFDIAPKWSRGITPTVRIGTHVFFDLSDAET